MDTQQLARNQLDGILRAATFISGINYEQRIEELEKQIAALVAALEGILDINNPPWGEPGHIDFITAIKMAREALAQVGE